MKVRVLLRIYILNISISILGYNLSILRGYSITGRTSILHIECLGSSPGISIAHVTQLVEWNTEDIFVISSSLIMGNLFYRDIYIYRVYFIG